MKMERYQNLKTSLNLNLILYQKESPQSKSKDLSQVGDYVEELFTDGEKHMSLDKIECEEAHQPEKWKTCLRLNDHILSKSEDCRKTVYKVCLVHCCQPEISLPFMHKCFPELKDYQTKCFNQIKWTKEDWDAHPVPDPRKIKNSRDTTASKNEDYSGPGIKYITPCADFNNINVTFSGHINLQDIRNKEGGWKQLDAHSCNTKDDKGKERGHYDAWDGFTLDPMKEWHYLPRPRPNSTPTPEHPH